MGLMRMLCKTAHFPFICGEDARFLLYQGYESESFPGTYIKNKQRKKTLRFCASALGESSAFFFITI